MIRLGHLAKRLLNALIWCSVVILVSMPLNPNKPLAFSAEEYAIKAAFVFNFVKFTEWPDHRFDTDGKPLRICFIGNGENAVYFKALEGKTIGTVTIAVHHPASDDCCGECDLVFVSRSAEPSAESRVIEKTDQVPVLTIGETENFAARGGVINFFIKNERLQFEINTRSAREKGLRLSSRLLKLARIVE